nr:ankyrin repeat domain-containing protein 50 [Quercus suber]
MAAALSGQHHVVCRIVENGADVKMQNGRYAKALQAAAMNGHNDIVMTLLAHDAEVDCEGGHADPNHIAGIYGTPLQAATSSNHISIARALLAHGAHVDATGGSMYTALHVAAMRDHVQVIQLLLEHRADATLEGGKFGTVINAAALIASHTIPQRLVAEGDAVVLEVREYYTKLMPSEYFMVNNEYRHSLVRAFATHHELDDKFYQLQRPKISKHTADRSGREIFPSTLELLVAVSVLEVSQDAVPNLYISGYLSYIEARRWRGNPSILSLCTYGVTKNCIPPAQNPSGEPIIATDYQREGTPGSSEACRAALSAQAVAELRIQDTEQLRALPAHPGFTLRPELQEMIFMNEYNVPALRPIILKDIGRVIRSERHTSDGNQYVTLWEITYISKLAEHYEHPDVRTNVDLLVTSDFLVCRVVELIAKDEASAPQPDLWYRRVDLSPGTILLPKYKGILLEDVDSDVVASMNCLWNTPHPPQFPLENCYEPPMIRSRFETPVRMCVHQITDSLCGITVVSRERTLAIPFHVGDSKADKQFYESIEGGYMVFQYHSIGADECINKISIRDLR